MRTLYHHVICYTWSQAMCIDAQMHQIIYMLSILYSWLDITWWMITRWMRIIVIFLCTEHVCIITITLSISLCHLAQSPLSLSVDTDDVLDYELFGHTIPFFCDNTTHANCDPLVWPMKMRGHEMLYLVRKIFFLLDMQENVHSWVFFCCVILFWSSNNHGENLWSRFLQHTPAIDKKYVTTCK